MLTAQDFNETAMSVQGLCTSYSVLTSLPAEVELL